jgi:pimeloyl-ACP methyl ester carboxylesterase
MRRAGKVRDLVVAGLRLECLDLPAARPELPAIVLLHEGLGCVAMWRDLPHRIAARTGCRTVAWSRAGHGGSEACAAPRGPRYLHEEALERLPEALAALGIARPLLVGHSDGGTIALVYAGAFPAAPAGVVALAPHEFVEEATLAGIRAAREAWERTGLRSRLARHHRDVDRLFAEWSQTWLSPGFRDWSVEEYLPAIRCPVVAIQGEQDEYATMRQVELIAESVPGAGLLKLPGCGHSPHRDRPEAVLDAIAALVGRAARAQG